MASPKSKRTRYVFVHPKLRHFVAEGFPGAVRVPVTSPKTPTRITAKRDASGRFTTPKKSTRSLGAKKAAQTRQLKKQGIRFKKAFKAHGQDPRRSYKLRRVTPEGLAALTERERSEGKNASYYIIVKYRDTDGNMHHRQTGWFWLGKSKRDRERAAQEASESVSGLFDQYEMAEIVNIEVVWGFSIPGGVTK